MPAADVILVCGGTGAGKSVRARALADQLGGIRYSIDEWMTTLFWMDSPQPIEFEWTISRIERCETMIWANALQGIARGCPAILDLGFATFDHREKFRRLACAAGLTVVLEYVDVPSEVRWERVQRRNAERGETFAMTVDRAMFDFMEARWQPPTSNELATSADPSIDPQASGR